MTFNDGADQIALIHRLVCAFVNRIQKATFSFLNAYFQTILSHPMCANTKLLWESANADQ